MQLKLNNKAVECGNLPDRHCKINLVKEYNGSYFRQAGTVKNNYPKLCCGCYRPLTA
jgi:hypothetical protein